MIISDSYRFVFVHIPKCAGTSIRIPLERLNEWGDAGPPWQTDHPELGFLDYGHIPLSTLRGYFPTIFAKICDYWTFAVMRDPADRFPSSISQHLKMYSGRPIHNLGLDEIKESIDHSIHFLMQQPRHDYLLPAKFIHFQKQVDYVNLDGRQVVDTIYMVDEVERLLSDVSIRVGSDMQLRNDAQRSHRAGRSLVHRNDLVRRMVEPMRPVATLLTRSLSESVKNRIRDVVYVPRDKRLESVFSSNYVEDFISDYYRADIDLWNDLLETRSKSGSD